MKIKTKLTLGVGLLFFLIIALVAVASRYVGALKLDTENILVANYNSIQYSRNMLSDLENMDAKADADFEKNLFKQANNLTEFGEKEVTDSLLNLFNRYKTSNHTTPLQAQIRIFIYKIMDLNLAAIQRKSALANATANKAVFWISISGCLCFIIAFVLLINLPSNIADPIQKLTTSIRNIAANKYNERVHFESSNEFGELAQSFNTMAQKLEEYNTSNLAKLMMEKKRIETLINNMHDPVIGLDEAFNVLFTNAEAIKICGIKKEDLLGKNIKQIAEKNDLIRKLIQDLDQTEVKPNQKQKQLKIYSNNKEGYFENNILPIAITPTGEETQQIIGHVIILRNVTEYKELDFAKTNFIATVSHEFKTPIASIKMSLELLKNKLIGPLNEEQTNLVTSIEDDSERLLKITKELLNMTQVESGNIQLSILPSNPKEIVMYAVNATKTQLEQKKIQLQIQSLENLPNVLADNEKTAWVITNLLSNAIRYSHDQSSINVNLEMAGKYLTISVKDFGQGIAPQYKEKIFDRYFRIPGTRKEGTGLGLAISKEFVEAQGGSISLESEYGGGSTFYVKLLLA